VPLILASAAFLIEALTSPAFAQIGDEQALQEVVVTATKRASNLQETPLALSAFTSSDLAASQTMDLADLATQTTGLYVGGDNSLGSNPVAIRGLGSINLSLGADEAVGVYIDGVYQGAPYTNGFQFIDAADIEVLRGPQGTLYGRNATGGAILVNTVTPGPDTIARGDIEATQLNGFEGKALLSGPLIENALYGKIAIGEASNDGYSYNPLTGQKLNGSRDFQVSTALRLFPGGIWDVTLRAFYGASDATPAAHNILSGLPIDDDPAEWPNSTTKDFTGGTLNASAKFDAFTFTSTSGYTHAETQSLTSSANVGLTQYRDTTDSHEWYQELRLSSPDHGPFTWLTGANLFDQVITDRTDFAELPVGLNFYNDLTTRSYAGFAELGYFIVPRLRLTAGVRHTDDSKDFENCFLVGAYSNIDTEPSNLCDGKYVPASNHWSALTPHFALDYRFTDSVFGYASATKGFRSGGWNYIQPVSPASGFDPEYVWSYEVGVKSEFLDHKVRLNADVFFAHYTDLQVRTYDPATDLFQVKNAATAKTRGAELGLTMKPVVRLLTTVNLSWLDAKYAQFQYTQPGFSPVNYAGNFLEYAPEWQASVTAEYAVPLPKGGSITPRIEASYVSQVFFDPTNTLPFSAPAHELANLRLRYDAASGNWGAQAFVDNVTGHRTPTYAYNGVNPSIFAVIFGPPRVAGVQIFWNSH
jgi:iron complex outermembrane recepter protein